MQNYPHYSRKVKLKIRRILGLYILPETVQDTSCMDSSTKLCQNLVFLKGIHQMPDCNIVLKDSWTSLYMYQLHVLIRNTNLWNAKGH